MQCLPKNRILEHHPDTFTVIRKEYNLDNPGLMEDAVRILREWVEKQQHFKKKNFSDTYLESVIITSKGSVERAKRQMDRMCTLRTLLPQFFAVRNAKTDFGVLFDIVAVAILPKLTPDHYRVYILKPNEKSSSFKDYLDYYIYLFILGDYLKIHNYSRGFIAIIDFSEVNVMDILTNMNPVQLRQAMSIFIEGYGMRIKGIHIFTSSKLIDRFVTLLKQLLSPKVSGRIFSHKTLDALPDVISKDILPEDYGGKEKPMRKIIDEWRDILSTEEHLNYLRDLSEAGTDESRRQTAVFNEAYAGMPGTFRLLTVD